MNEESVMEILHSGGYSLVIWNNGIHTFTGRGVSDLYRIYNEQEELLHGAVVADKIIGKGAAALMALGKVSEIFTDTISAPALSLLKDCGIPVSFQTVVPNIINRRGDGVCPVETLCLECVTPAECLPLIERFMMGKK